MKISLFSIFWQGEVNPNGYDIFLYFKFLYLYFCHTFTYVSSNQPFIIYFSPELTTSPQ